MMLSLTTLKLPAHLHTGIDIIVGFTRIGEMQVLNGGAVGVQQDDGALATGVNSNFIPARLLPGLSITTGPE